MQADVHASAQREFSVHSDAAIRFARRDVNLGGEVGEPGVTDRTFRRCTSTPRVETRLRHLKYPAGALDRAILRDHHSDSRVSVFWGLHILEQLSRATRDLEFPSQAARSADEQPQVLLAPR